MSRIEDELKDVSEWELTALVSTLIYNVAPECDALVEYEFTQFQESRGARGRLDANSDRNLIEENAKEILVDSQGHHQEGCLLWSAVTGPLEPDENSGDLSFRIVFKWRSKHGFRAEGSDDLTERRPHHLTESRPHDLTQHFFHDMSPPTEPLAKGRIAKTLTLSFRTDGTASATTLVSSDETEIMQAGMSEKVSSPNPEMEGECDTA